MDGALDTGEHLRRATGHPRGLMFAHPARDPCLRQDIEADRHGTEAWYLEHPARCFIHLANAEQWQAITGEPMPTRPITPADYARHGITWFEYAATVPKAPGADTLAELKSVAEVEHDAGRTLPDDGPIPIDRIRRLPTRHGDTVRDDPDLG